MKPSLKSPALTAAVALAGLLLPGTSSAAGLHEAELIATAESLRLPGGRRSHNHSPSIVQTPAGDLLVGWFHGKGEREDNTMVAMGARKKKDARVWSAPFVMADFKGLPDQNTTLFIDPQQRLWLFRISSLDNEKRGHFLTYLISTDYEGDGPPRWKWQAPLFCAPQDLEKTYVAAVDRLLKGGKISPNRREEFVVKKELAKDKLWHRLGWMPRTPPLMLNERRMMLGLYSDVWDCSMMAFTEDAGETWEFSQPMIFSDSLLTKSIQPALVRKKNGNIVAFMRARPVVRRAESSDGGMTWIEDPLDIRCPNTSVAALALKSGRWLLAVNDTAGGRNVLTAYLSDDEGKTWPWKRAFEHIKPPQGSGNNSTPVQAGDERVDTRQGAAHYPTLIQAADGGIHIVYTYANAAEFEGNTIKHARFDEAWVMNK